MLLTIDYLILNFKGSLALNKKSLYSEDVSNPFTTVKHEYGNKTYRDVYDLFYNDERLAVINMTPTSPVIPADLVQIQFENHLFYTYSLRDLNELVFALVDYFDLRLDGINRLDIAYDKSNCYNEYVELYDDLIKKRKKIKGRRKAVNAYMETENGDVDFNGFIIGKRSSSRLLRVYNKTKALLDPKTPKTYINEYFQKNNIANTIDNPVWRFEYQLNNKFFSDLRERNEVITWQIFDADFLCELIQKAEKNHFEIVYNTGKSESNKEEAFIINDWQEIKANIGLIKTVILEKIKKVFEPSINTQKRLIKGLFRQYYIEPNLAFLYPLTKVINEYNLKDWFYEKYHFYLREFHDKERIKNFFNEAAFVDRYYSLTV